MTKFKNKLDILRSRLKYQPLVFSFVCIALLGFLMNSFYSQNQETKQEAVDSDIESVASIINGRVKSHSEFASLLADEYGESQLQKKFFIKKSGKFAKNHPELTSISIIDENGSRRWIFPESIEHIRSSEVTRDPIQGVVEEALNTEQQALSSPYASLQGATAIAVAVPIVKDLEVSGAVVVQIDLEKLVRTELRSEYKERYRIELNNSKGTSLINIFVPDKGLTEIVSVKNLFNSAYSPTISLIRYQSPFNWLIVSLSLVCFCLVLGLTFAINVLSKDNRERKTVQIELERAKNAAEQANNAKSQLIANISHEIRTPLGAIQGYTDLLQRYSLSKEERRRTVKAIKRNTFQLLNIIGDMLDMSKIEAGLLESEEVEFHMLDAIQDIIETVNLYSQKPHILIELDLATPMPAIVIADQGKFSQILTNLISNSVKFSEEGSVRVAVSFDSPSITIKVIDTGIGMSEDQAKRIFRPFVQADTSIARKYGGTGLGLALSKTFAERLGGDLELTESILGQGSTFTFTFSPKLSDEIAFVESLEELILEENESSPDQGDRELLDITILIVEDCKDNQIIYAKYLEEAGAHVIIASSGFDALEKSPSPDIDIIIMDIQMPEIDGYEATQLLRARGLICPIVALTAHAMKGERERCLNAGCDDYITKPIDSDSLVEKIKELINVPERRRIGKKLRSKMHTNPRVRPLLPSFLTGIQARIQDMRIAASTGNHQAIAILSHQLKGTALNYGYPTISDEAARVESMSLEESKDTHEVLVILTKIEDQAKAALAAL